MPASMVTAILQGYPASHSAQLPVHTKVKKILVLRKNMDYLIEFKPRSMRMEPGCIAVTDGMDQIGFHFTVRNEFSVQFFFVSTGRQSAIEPEVARRQNKVNPLQRTIAQYRDVDFSSLPTNHVRAAGLRGNSRGSFS
jgi:hypothetical protein